MRKRQNCRLAAIYFNFIVVLGNMYSLYPRDLGIETLSNCEDEQNEMLRLAQTMFDTKLPPGVTMLQPFAEESSIKKIAVKVCL